MQICRPDKVCFLESEEEKEHQSAGEDGTPPEDPLPALAGVHVTSADRAYERPKGQTEDVKGKFCATFVRVVSVRHLDNVNIAVSPVHQEKNTY